MSGERGAVPCLGGSHPGPPPPARASAPAQVYQTSTMAALLDGIYDGDVTVAELLTHGDFGLGTFNHLDGEMVHPRRHLLPPARRRQRQHRRTPGQDPVRRRAVVPPGQDPQDHEPSDRAALTGLVDSAIPSPNLTYALRVSGGFARVRTRTVMAQQPPYPPLTEATSNQPVTDLEHVTGTLAGFRTPAYEQGISVAGYHLHFLTEDRATAAMPSTSRSTAATSPSAPPASST